MPVPSPIGRIHPNEPRAVMIRDIENQKAPHSAIHCGINIFTDNKAQTDLIIEKWPELLMEFSNTLENMLAFEEDHD